MTVVSARFSTGSGGGASLEPVAAACASGVIRAMVRSACPHLQPVLARARLDGHLEAAVGGAERRRHVAAVEPYTVDARARRKRRADPQRAHALPGAHLGPPAIAVALGAHARAAGAEPDLAPLDPVLALRQLRHDLQHAAAEVGPHAELLV